MNEPNDISSANESWIESDVGGYQISPVMSKNYGFPTMESSILGAKERAEYGLDEKQLSRAAELGLDRNFIDEIEQRQIRGKKLLAAINAMPKELIKILFFIFESIRLDESQKHITQPQTLPTEWHQYVKDFIKEYFPDENIYSMYAGNAFYAPDIATGVGYERILFLLNIWALYPDILGGFYKSTQLLMRGTDMTGKPFPDVLEYLLVSTGGVRLNTSHTPFPVIMNAPSITVDMLVTSFSNEAMSEELGRFIRHMDFTFLGSIDPKDIDIEYKWFLEAIVIGGYLVEKTSLVHPPGKGNPYITQEEYVGISENVLKKFFYTYYRTVDNKPHVTSLLQKMYDKKRLSKIIIGYIDRARQEQRKITHKKTRKTHTSIASAKQNIQSGIFSLSTSNILSFSYPYTGDIIVTINKNNIRQLSMKNNSIDISDLISEFDISRDYTLDIGLIDTDTYRVTGDTILWKSPVLEHLKTSTLDLSGAEKYAFERGDITVEFFRSLENAHTYNEYIGAEIISPEGVKITEDDLPIKNGKYEFRYFLKSNPEITSKSTYYTRNKKESAQVVNRVESKFIEVMDTPQEAPQEIITLPTGISVAQKSFENALIDALSDEKYSINELTDSLYEIELAQKIVIHYERNTGIFTLISDSDIILSDDMQGLLRDDIIEPYLDTKEMLRKNEALEAKESQIKALKKIRNIYRRELESYNTEDIENPFDVRIDTMMRRDAQGRIIGYAGYGTIAFGKHAENLQALLSKTPGITLGIDKEQKSILISFEQGTMRATIRSTKSAPYYEISSYGFEDDARDIEQVFLDTLRYLYLLTGVMSTGEKKENIYTSREGKNMILDAYKRLEKGEAKIELDSGWYHGGWYESKIEGKKGLDVLTGDDDIRIVLHDESIAVADKGPGQTNVYERIRDNIRLQKYLILRIVATIRGEKYKNKSPLTGAMRDVFIRIWEPIDTVTKKGFTDIFEHNEEGSTDVALIYEVNGVNFFQKVLHSWEASGVALVYRSPQIIGVDEFHEYIADMREKGELS